MLLVNSKHIKAILKNTGWDLMSFEVVDRITDNFGFGIINLTTQEEQKFKIDLLPLHTLEFRAVLHINHFLKKRS